MLRSLLPFRNNIDRTGLWSKRSGMRGMSTCCHLSNMLALPVKISLGESVGDIRLGQLSIKCKVVGIFGEKLANIHIYVIWICWIQKSCLPSWILTFRSRVTKNKMATKNDFFSQNSATYIRILSNITTVMYTNLYKLTSCHRMYGIKYQGK